MNRLKGNYTQAVRNWFVRSSDKDGQSFEQRRKRDYEELRTNAQSGNDVLHASPVQRRYERIRACKDTSHAGGKQVDKPMARFDGIVKGDSVQSPSKNKGIDR